jgi:hypothetical protein
MKKKRTLTIAIAMVVVLIGIWRICPHSLKDILNPNEKTFSTISVQVSEFGVSNNSPNIDVYKLEIASPQDENYESIVSIIESTKFRQDFRNLLPWNTLSVSSGSKNITHSAIVMLKWGSSNDEVCHITFHDDRIVSFSFGGSTEFLVYHPTNRTALNQIVEYTKENGILQK